MLRRIRTIPTEHGLAALVVPMVLFILVAVLIVWDIVDDLAVGATVFHVTIEFIIMFAAVAGAVYFWDQLRIARRLEKDLQKNLEKACEETTRWQDKEQNLLDELRIAIDKQLTQWDFSSKEKEIAFYLMKGLSFKEIAELRGGTFQSIKQQAHVLYRKAGLSGRAELSAFFLGGIL